MWYPVSLKIVNLFSFQDVEFIFIKGKLVPIYGLNKTDPKVLSNGSGKSSLGNVISIAFTGSPLKKIRKASIVRRGQTSGNYEFLLKNNVSGQELLIKEFVEKTKSNKVEIYENGKINDRLKDLAPDIAHKYILEQLDISEDDLLNYYLLSKSTYTSFFTTKDGQKKEVINRFSKANVIDPIDGFIKADIEKIDKKITPISQEIITKNAQIDLLLKQINEAKLTDLEKISQETIKELEEKVLTFSDENEETEKAIKTLKEDREVLISERNAYQTDTALDNEFNKIAKRTVSKSQQLEKERKVFQDIDIKYEEKLKAFDIVITQVEKEIEENKLKIRGLNIAIAEIEKHLAEEIECPKCKHKFCFEDKAFDLEDAKKQLPTFKKTITTKEKNILTLEKKIENHKQDKQKLIETKNTEQTTSLTNGKKFKKELGILERKEKRLKQLLLKDKNLINELSSLIIELDSSITLKQNNISFNEEQIKQLFNQVDIEKEKKEEDKIKPLEQQAEQLSNELLEEEGKKITLDAEKEELQIWRLRFKKFKSYLANNSISSIESLTNHYLQGMGTHLTCSISGYREKADGELKEEITAEISTDGGVTSENYHEFSGGEQSKVDVAGILAMQKLINLNSKSGGLDLLLIDEIIDSIDRIALNELIQSLDKIGQIIMLISHIELPEMENSVKIEKRLGISYIIKN
jgi:exonuclease SbcC